jgi:hypothetical protein
MRRSKGIPLVDRFFTLFMCISTGFYAFCMHVCKVPSRPKKVHLRAVKRIMRYLVYTPKFGLWYPGDQPLI